jgi:hypothetical protein
MADLPYNFNNPIARLSEQTRREAEIAGPKPPGNIFGAARPKPREGNLILSFPSDLSNTLAGYPHVSFSTVTSPGDGATGNMFKHVHLPMPVGVSFGDGGSYSSIDLGILGAGGMDALQNVANGQGTVDSLKSGVSGTVNQAVNLKAIEKASIISKFIPKIGDKVKEKGFFAQKKIDAPNTNTSFTGNTVRTFSFAFTMIAKNKADTAVIKDIHNFFRRYTYASADSGAPNLILDYPPVWTIKFHADGRENPYYPRIFGCYLTGFTTTFNSSQNAFRTDGSPLEVTIGLSYQETRVLNAIDIEALQSGTSNLGIDENTQLATSATTVRKTP